jgi:hypothetical protein
MLNDRKDPRDLLEVLKAEQEFLEKGGYDSLFRKPWRPSFVFEDSPSCPNSVLREDRVPCADCVLMELVPAERRGEKVPCRFIPLNESGETIDDYYRSGSPEELYEAFREWLVKTIYRLQEQRAQKPSPGASAARTN